MSSVILFNQEESDAQRRNLGHVRVCTQVAKHVAARKLKRLRARDGPRKELCRTSAELLSRKVHRGACTEMYSDAQKCSDFAQEFQDVKLHLFPCPGKVKRMRRFRVG